MLNPNHPVFRKNALQHYLQGQEKDTVPQFINTPLALVMWLLLAIVVVTCTVSWYQEIPLYNAGAGIVLKQVKSDQSNVVVFVPWSPALQPRVGQTVSLSVGGASSQQITGTIAQVNLKAQSPATLCQQYELMAGCSLLVRQPSIAILIQAQALPTERYAGAIVLANVQTGSQRMLAFFPGLEWLAGKSG
ncbi:hypothetical protein KSD_12710 [Ktedonobacter sp. SOSP1-85]|uniref:Uncharacterized protein n=1 Tax=Ktedonobacter robiniae TaxID=2778365 RepID=A0ABQ3UQH3_9CHLR|nr:MULTISPECIES: hypothetical protein [Ktedonobacter]GHO54857.1 hypothetical protein KSB_33320 [Ktedonobacter robiniae]GHO73500.1 hypothetical protein KSD_12710 [Ktedonobacter sp. SOSP1-85]